MIRLVKNVDKCTGCCMCMLACSMQRLNTFNIRHARIKVSINLTGLPEKIDFIDGCDQQLKQQCSFTCKAPVCVQYCLHGAIELVSDDRVFNAFIPDVVW